MAHAAPRRRGCSGYESRDRFFAIVFHPRGRFLLGRPADLTDHNDGFGIGIVVEHLEDIQM